jgi:hypothetical protein
MNHVVVAAPASNVAQGLPIPVVPRRAEASGYAHVAAESEAEALGAGGGALGDFISHILVTPGSVSPGSIVLSDGETDLEIFAGGADSLSNLVPFVIALGMTSASGPWQLTTGADVSCIAVGSFA